MNRFGMLLMILLSLLLWGTIGWGAWMMAHTIWLTK